MFIGSLQVQLRVPEANSLKSKRFVIKSVIERIRSRFNVSVSEISDMDLWQSSLLGVVMVGNEKRHMNEVLDKVMNFLECERRLEVLDSQLDFL